MGGCTRSVVFYRFAPCHCRGKLQHCMLYLSSLTIVVVVVGKQYESSNVYGPDAISAIQTIGESDYRGHGQ